ncbi:hypothetical protein EMIT0215P_50190 [Pseudomonas serboccidentalis]
MGAEHLNHAAGNKTNPGRGQIWRRKWKRVRNCQQHDTDDSLQNACTLAALNDWHDPNFPSAAKIQIRLANIYAVSEDRKAHAQAGQSLYFRFEPFDRAAQ